MVLGYTGSTRIQLPLRGNDCTSIRRQTLGEVSVEDGNCNCHRGAAKLSLWGPEGRHPPLHPPPGLEVRHKHSGTRTDEHRGPQDDEAAEPLVRNRRLTSLISEFRRAETQLLYESTHAPVYISDTDDLHECMCSTRVTLFSPVHLYYTFIFPFYHWHIQHFSISIKPLKS